MKVALNPYRLLSENNNAKKKGLYDALYRKKYIRGLKYSGTSKFISQNMLEII